MKKRGERITALTAYDHPTARLLDEAGIDLILVGDSLGMVIQGRDSTLAVTMDEIIYHTRLVARAVHQALVVADMPYGSYHLSPEQAVANAIRVVKKTGCDAVKVEGGSDRVSVIRALLAAEVPVMGHIGLTPQSVKRLGGYKIQGRQLQDIERLITDAETLQEAGCFSLVLEGIPHPVGRIISRKLEIPAIGIGAGPHCDGQILVFHDMMGLNEAGTFRFVRQYAQLAELIRRSLTDYQQDIRTGRFPSLEESFPLEESIEAQLEEIYGSYLEDEQT
ncbi:MAG: 3-methyl-2-oxobutanoate hydroxymethyltransferase [Acidobacteria bacterium]|nr:3-methyl-2-oxobutanoate hydroxymethyltransferase [Acidobacteriota bacterium]